MVDGCGRVGICREEGPEGSGAREERVVVSVGVQVDGGGAACCCGPVRWSLSDVGVQVGVEQVPDSVEQPPGDDDTVVCRCSGGAPAALKDSR